MRRENYANRRNSLRKLMGQKGLDALVISHDANRYYLSGFELHDPQMNESSGYLIITRHGDDWLCTDARYTEAASRLWDTDRICIYSGPASEQINALLRKEGYTSIGYEAHSLCVSFFRSLSRNLEMVAADGLVESLRRIKEPEEIQALRRSCAVNHRLMEWLPSQLRPGRTEAEIAWEIEKFFRENGASELAFSSIVAVGPNAALPHAIPGDTVITENCPVLIDVGCRVDEYCSDQTRTFWVGAQPTDVFVRTVELVRAAQDKVIARLHPGMFAAEAHRIARAVFEDACVEMHFTHSLGHGVGLETHESPSVSLRSKMPLEAGMVITVEPGLYYPEWGGVRWEYMVLITEDGAEIL